MTTLDELIQKTEAASKRALADRNGWAERLSMLQKREKDGLPVVPDNVTDARARLADADTKLDSIMNQLREYKAEAEDDARIVAAQFRTQPTEAAQRAAGFEDGEYRSGQRAGAAVARTGEESPRFVFRDRPDVPATVSRGQSFRDHPLMRDEMAARAATDATVQGVYGGSLAQMVRTVTDSGTSAVVPTAWSSDLIDLARNYAAVFQAGATLVPMNAVTVNIGRVTGDPSATFRTEGSTITASDPTLDNVTLTAKTMSCLVIASMEWIQDAINGEELIRNEIAKAMALALDKAALYGGILTGDASGVNLPVPPNPRGVLAALNALRPANVLGSAATNGTALTQYDQFIDLDFTVENLNENPTGLILPTRLAQSVAKLKDSQNRPLDVPPALRDLPFIQSNQVASGMTKGSATTGCDAFVADWSQLLIGQRLEMTIQRLDQRYADAGQVGFVCNWRGDIQPARTSAFAVYRYLVGS